MGFSATFWSVILDVWSVLTDDRPLFRPLYNIHISSEYSVSFSFSLPLKQFPRNMIQHQSIQTICNITKNWS